MKKVFLLVVFVSVIFGNAVAQDNIIGLEPIRLWSGLRFKYERVMSERFTLGTQATFYYGSYPGFQASPLARFYFKGNAPEGFYAQTKIPLGVFTNDYTALINGEIEDKKQTFFSGGLGVALGWQVLWGKSENWSIDFHMGVKLVTPVPEPDDAYSYSGDASWDNAWDNVGWYITAPGSILDVLLTVGYRF